MATLKVPLDGSLMKCRCASGTATRPASIKGLRPSTGPRASCPRRPGRYRLVRMPDTQRRSAKMGVADLAFGDSYPFLIISEASLEDLAPGCSTPYQ